MNLILVMLATARLAAGQATHAEGEAVAEPTAKEGVTEGAVAADAAVADAVVDAAAVDAEGRTKGSSSPRFFAGSSNLNSNAGRPFQQGGFNSNAGRPIQGGNFNSNAGRPIQGGRPFQQGNFNSNAGRPFQQGGNFNSNVGRPFQQGGNFNSNGGRPFQQGGNFNSNGGRPFQQGGFNSQSGFQGNLGHNLGQSGLQHSLTLGHAGGVTSNLGLVGGQGIGTGLVGGQGIGTGLVGGQGIGTGLVGGIGQHVGSVTSQGKCSFFCEDKFGNTVCCERPGFCPAVRPSCPRFASAPQNCVNDIDCSLPSKCCFDVCLCKSVCKPPQTSRPLVTFESSPTQCIAQQQSLV